MPKNNSYKIKISIGDAIIEIEGEVVGVTKIVDSLKSILQGRTVVAPDEQKIFPSDKVVEGGVSVFKDIKDIRTFFQEKKPRSFSEAAATVAFYLQYVESEATNRREAIDVDILKDELRKANFQLPKVLSQVLVDAKKTGYLDAVGTGQYKLNSVGYNLVKFALGKDKEKTIKKRPKKKKKSKK